MPQLWTITRLSDGAVLAACFPTPSTGSHPKDNGWGWDAAAQKATRIDAPPDLASQVWTGMGWADDPAKVEAALIAAVKVEAERRKMLAASAGGFKKTEYAAKRNEVIAWDMLGGTAGTILTAFGLLPAAVKAMRFEYAIADAAKFGDQPANAIARFRAGIAAAASTSVIAAVEAKAVADIRSATGAAGKRAAASAVTWGS